MTAAASIETPISDGQNVARRLAVGALFAVLLFRAAEFALTGFAAIGYLFRPYQVVRSRRLNVPPGHNQPPRRGAGA